jgi:hypothetical protein
VAGPAPRGLVLPDVLVAEEAEVRHSVRIARRPLPDESVTARISSQIASKSWLACFSTCVWHLDALAVALGCGHRRVAEQVAHELDVPGAPSTCFLGAMMLALAALGFFASGCATLWYAATLAALSLAPWRSRLFQTPLISGAWLALYAFFLRLAKAPLTDVLARAELGWGTALLCGVVFRASLPFWRKYPTSTPE